MNNKEVRCITGDNVYREALMEYLNGQEPELEITEARYTYHYVYTVEDEEYVLNLCSESVKLQMCEIKRNILLHGLNWIRENAEKHPFASSYTLGDIRIDIYMGDDPCIYLRSDCFQTVF
jgi:hypothetical protein